MSNRSAAEIWEATLGELQVQVSKPNYRTWFQKTVGISYEDSVFLVGVPNAFVGEYLDKNQRSLIEKALMGHTAADVRVVFQVNGRRPATARDEAPCFNPHYVFDTFVEGEGNRLARAAALAVSRQPGDSYNPLFIHGGVGLGKTHLLHAIGQEALSRQKQPLCVSAEQFTHEFVSALQGKRMDDFRSRFRRAGLLLIDDIHFISGKTQTEESFFHIFNELHNAGCQMVLTSDRPPREIRGLTDRLRSRFEWGLMVDIQPPDYETRLAILQARARQQEVPVPPDILEFIAQQMRQSIRDLEGSLNRVVAYSRLLQALPTLETAQRALENLASQPAASTPRSPGRLLQAAAGVFQISPEDIVGRKRDKETVLARRVAMYLLRQETGCSLAGIGEMLGGRDAAAVANACKKVNADMSSDPYLRRKLQEIQRQINPLPEV